MIITNQKGKDLICAKIQALKVSPDKPWEITGNAYKPKKTDPQRNWFHKLCGILAQPLGFTKGDIKEMALCKMYGTKKVTQWGMVVTRPDMPYSTSEDIPKDDYTQLIDIVYWMGAESNTPLPDPQKDL